MSPSDLAAHLEIQQTLYRYCRGVDRGDRALVASVYHPDAIDRHGAWSGLGREFADRVVSGMDEAGVVGQHHITNAIIELHGDEADVESYFIAINPGRTDAGPGHAVVCGRYLDRFEKRGGAWRIADRQVVIDVSRPLEHGPGWPGADTFPAGGRREADPSAEWLGRRERKERV
jgi:hypothetical protein